VCLPILLVDTGVVIVFAKLVARDVMVICGGGIGSVGCIVGGQWRGWWQSW
jgi:hypothetical protein